MQNSACYELISALPRESCPQQMFDRLAQAGRSLGFEYCALGVRLPYPLSNARIEIFNNYPEGWRQRYASQGYLARDPSVVHGRRCSTPRVWDEPLFASDPDIWDEARASGLRHGWFKSTLETGGSGSMLTLARSAEPLAESELRAHGEKLAWLTHAAHLAFTKVLMPAELREPQCQLTVREIEVLRWTADGKSSSEIADILTISDNTVNFHIKNAIKKLRTNNKTAATVRAAVLGLLAS